MLRFADRNSLSNTNCSWSGLIRGFAYFNKVLNTNQVLEIDKLLPRVGAIFEGDSKTAANDWYLHYCETTNTWGLYSVLTNSAVSGTVVSSLNASSGSMEHRWPNNARFRTNSQMPRIVYSLRGGHNDFSGPNIAQGRYITNAFKSITNLWGLSRSNGWMAMGWTIDRTGTTWSGNNTNYLKLLNGWIRQHSHLCDALMDAEDWFVANFGETPFNNPDIYQPWPGNPVHETALGAELLGRAAGMMAAPSLPEPPFKLSILPGEAPGSQLLEVSGAPARTEIDILYSTNNRDWFELMNFIPEAGWAEIPLEQPPEATMRFYMARTRVMNVTP